MFQLQTTDPIASNHYVCTNTEFCNIYLLPGGRGGRLGGVDLLVTRAVTA